MIDPITLARTISDDLKIIWHGPPASRVAAVYDILKQSDSAETYFLTALALAEVAAIDLRRARPVCVDPAHAHAADGFYGFDAADLPEGGMLQAVQTFIAMSNGDRETASAIIRIYAATPTAESAAFLSDLIHLVEATHTATCKGHQ